MWISLLLSHTTTYLHEISVWGRISPSQFHTDTERGLVQQGPHAKPCLFNLLVSLPLSFHPARCCCEWPAMLPLNSFSGSSSSLSAEVWISRLASFSYSSSSSSASPGGRENRTALTRWTSTKGRSNWNDSSEMIFLTDSAFSWAFIYLNVIWLYLILFGCVPVKVCEKAKRVSFSDHDEVCRPIGQVSGRRKTLWAPWTWAWHTGERDTLEPAFNSHPLTWNSDKKVIFFSIVYITSE